MSDLKRITCIEDDPDIRELTRIALQDIGGFTVDLCASGAEAIAKTPAFDPDIVLLDVMMPEMDGPETFRRLRAIQQLSEKPIVFMTAKVQPSEIKKYEEMGAAGVIMKPFDPMTLPDEIRSLWGCVSASS
ncbi:MAG: response regulator [Candidatus Tectomicrobia bacterium]|nr:response regulator [Candidatus Tectomicrobia bacterium]